MCARASWLGFGPFCMFLPSPYSQSSRTKGAPAGFRGWTSGRRIGVPLGPSRPRDRQRRQRRSTCRSWCWAAASARAPASGAPSTSPSASPSSPSPPIPPSTRPPCGKGAFVGSSCVGLASTILPFIGLRSESTMWVWEGRTHNQFTQPHKALNHLFLRTLHTASTDWCVRPSPLPHPKIMFAHLRTRKLICCGPTLFRVTGFSFIRSDFPFSFPPGFWFYIFLCHLFHTECKKHPDNRFGAETVFVVPTRFSLRILVFF